MRVSELTGVLQILPSPMRSVRAASAIALTTVDTSSSPVTTTSTLSFGSRSTVYSAPR